MSKQPGKGDTRPPNLSRQLPPEATGHFYLHELARLNAINPELARHMLPYISHFRALAYQPLVQNVNHPPVMRTGRGTPEVPNRVSIPSISINLPPQPIEHRSRAQQTNSPSTSDNNSSNAQHPGQPPQSSEDVPRQGGEPMDQLPVRTALTGGDMEFALSPKDE